MLFIQYLGFNQFGVLVSQGSAGLEEQLMPVRALPVDDLMYSDRKHDLVGVQYGS